MDHPIMTPATSHGSLDLQWGKKYRGVENQAQWPPGTPDLLCAAYTQDLPTPSSFPAQVSLMFLPVCMEGG